MSEAPYTCEYPFAPGCERPAFKPKTPDSYHQPTLIYCTTHWREALVETLEDNAEWFIRMQRAEGLLRSLSINPIIPEGIRTLMKESLP